MDESFWWAVCFCIFAYLVYKPAKRSILKALDDRVKYIKEEFVKVEALRKESAELLSKAEADLTKIESIKDLALKEAREKSFNIIMKRQEELDASLLKKEKETIEFIEREKTLATIGLKNELVDFSTKLAKEYLSSISSGKISDRDIAELFLNPKSKKVPNE